MVKLLDCTLRDGGYINNWEFGKKNIVNVIDRINRTNIDILEVGFLKNEPYCEDRTVFNRVEQINELISPKVKNILYAAMIEVMNPVPVESIAECNENTVDIIRVIVWKDMHDEHGNKIDALKKGYEYCKGIVKKGYKLCVQPARVDQYSDEEFEDMITMFSELSPYAIYVVDSWGTLTTHQIMHYVKIADDILPSSISIGYHGHNNMLQAYGTATTFVEYKFKDNRDIIVDASVYGIGRCAGNLNLEIFASYLNMYCDKKYAIEPMVEVYERCVKDIYLKHQWGYCVPYFITAIYNCHPNYGYYYSQIAKLSEIDINKIVSSIEGEDKVLYCKETADKYIKKILGV